MANEIAAGIKLGRKWFRGCQTLHLLAMGSRELLAMKLRQRGALLHLCHLHRFPLESAAGSPEWLESVMQKLLQLPAAFRRQPCLLVAPHLSPILKFVEIPQVESQWHRKTLGQAWEMELPIHQEDYFWDHILTCKNPQREGSSIFAERRNRLQPLFELISSASILLKSVLLPLEADFHQLAHWHGTLAQQGMQINIENGCLSLGCFGGHRPFLRYANGGWDRLLAAVAEETRESISDLHPFLNRWLAREDLENSAVRASFEKHGPEFFEWILQEMLRTELHYIRHLGGKTISLALVSGSTLHLERFGEWLESRRHLTVRTLNFSESFSCSRQFRSEMADLPTATRLHVYWAVQHFLRQSPAILSPLLPEALRQKLLRRQRQSFGRNLLLWIGTWLALGCTYRYGEMLHLRSALQEKTHRQAQLKVEWREYQKISERLGQSQRQVELSERIHRQQGHWLELFDTLQGATVLGEETWLSDFHLDRSQENGSQQLELRLTGNLLQRPGEDLQRLQQRLDRFLRQLEHSPLIRKMGELRLFTGEEYRLRFECVLKLAPEKLLQ